MAPVKFTTKSHKLGNPNFLIIYCISLNLHRDQSPLWPNVLSFHPSSGFALPLRDRLSLQLLNQAKQPYTHLSHPQESTLMLGSSWTLIQSRSNPILHRKPQQQERERKKGLLAYSALALFSKVFLKIQLEAH